MSVRRSLANCTSDHRSRNLRQECRTAAYAWVGEQRLVKQAVEVPRNAPPCCKTAMYGIARKEDLPMGTMRGFEFAKDHLCPRKSCNHLPMNCAYGV